VIDFVAQTIGADREILEGGVEFATDKQTGI
jgi:hypothetical protein